MTFVSSSPTLFLMGGERASTTRMRESRRICCSCKVLLEPPPARERYCAKCKPTHRVYMHFMETHSGFHFRRARACVSVWLAHRVPVASPTVPRAACRLRLPKLSSSSLVLLTSFEKQIDLSHTLCKDYATDAPPPFSRSAQASLRASLATRLSDAGASGWHKSGPRPDRDHCLPDCLLERRLVGHRCYPDSYG